MGDFIESWIVFFFLMLVLPIVGIGLYLIYKGRLKLFFAIYWFDSDSCWPFRSKLLHEIRSLGTARDNTVIRGVVF